MSSLTKEQMRNALISHGVTNLPPQGAKKEELVALYEKHILPATNGAGDFSSDDEVSLKPSPSKRASTASKASRVSNVSKASKSSKTAKKALVEDSMIVDGVDVSALDDDVLFEKLKEHGISAGPIVDSTRKLYQKKLLDVLMLKGATANKINGKEVEYSDTEEEVGEVVEEVVEEEDDQPAAVITEPTVTTRRSASAKNSNSSQKMSPAKSPFASMLKETIGLRSRGGQDSLDAAGEGKLTPTPRRSIHSYKVSETTKQVITRNRDGTETRDVQRTVERTENGRVVSESSGCMKYLVKILKLSAVLAVLAAVYLAFTNKNDEANSFDQIIDAVNTAQAESGQETEAPPAANIADV